MRRLVSFILCLALCFGFATRVFAQSPPPFDSFREWVEGPQDGEYVVSPGDPVIVSGDDVMLQEGACLRILEGGHFELRGAKLTNCGEVIVETGGRVELRPETEFDNQNALNVSGNFECIGGAFRNEGTVIVGESGRLEVRKDGDSQGEFLNEQDALCAVRGHLEFVGGNLENHGTVSLEGTARFAQGATLENLGAFTGEGEGRLVLDDQYPPFVNGIALYDGSGDEEETPDKCGEFRYEGRWVRSHSGTDEPPGPEDIPGAFLRFFSQDDEQYVIYEDVVVTEQSSVRLNGRKVTVNEGITVTVDSGGMVELVDVETVNKGTVVTGVYGRLEVRGGGFVNLGTIRCEKDVHGSPPEDGRLHFRDSAVLDNRGTLEIDGSARLMGGILRNHGNVMVGENGRFEARKDNDVQGEVQNEEGSCFCIFGHGEIIDGQFQNRGTVTVHGTLRFGDGAVLNNEACLTGEGAGRLVFCEGIPVAVSGLSFYEKTGEEIVGGIHGEFECRNSRWQRCSEGSQEPGTGPVGDGSIHTVTVGTPVNGAVLVEELQVQQVEILDVEGAVTFTIRPDPGYRVLRVLLVYEEYEDDQTFNLAYAGNGEFEFPLTGAERDVKLVVEFGQVGDMSDLMEQNFVVLQSQALDEGELVSTVVRQCGHFGYVVLPEQVRIREIDMDNILTQGYGTFTFALAFEGFDSQDKTGYILPSASHIMFKMSSGDAQSVTVVDASAYHQDELPVPAMACGTLEILGYGDLIAAPLDPELPQEDGKVLLPFYCAQFHIFNLSPDAHFNLYGVYLIQDDALCLSVSAKSGQGDEQSIQWDLGRYTNLTNGDAVSDVFFGNDEFLLALPQEGVGAARTLSLQLGEFPGYVVEESGGAYCVRFLSDFYDSITLDLFVNDEPRKLRVERKGVHIALYEQDYGQRNDAVFHGTQISTLIDYDDGNAYRVYATYHIPHGGNEAPHGLYVTYTWRDGHKISQVITTPCDSPHPAKNAERYENSVFMYEGKACCCDYLIYSAEGSHDAPVEINVLVLRDNPDRGEFGGILFGSGAGVTWRNLRGGY